MVNQISVVKALRLFSGVADVSRHWECTAAAAAARDQRRMGRATPGVACLKKATVSPIS